MVNVVERSLLPWLPRPSFALSRPTDASRDVNRLRLTDSHRATWRMTRPVHQAIRPSPTRLGRPEGAVSGGLKSDPNEYRIVVACDPARISDTVDGQATNCSYAVTACQFRNPPSNDILYRLETRPRTPPNSPWTTVRDMCGLTTAPPGVPAPAVPTMGQIQTAFRQLPFSKPTVSIQPAGNVTLVNLPTYYRATWPDDAGLQPGEISEPVQLLSWSVEFKIAARSYDFHFGDSASSGQVTDAGGVYPTGSIRHTYAHPNAATKVSVDSRLTGQFRVNGGEWTDIDTVADLQDEPVTTLQVREATARLVAH